MLICPEVEVKVKNKRSGISNHTYTKMDVSDIDLSAGQGMTECDVTKVKATPVTSCEAIGMNSNGLPAKCLEK